MRLPIVRIEDNSCALMRSGDQILFSGRIVFVCPWGLLLVTITTPRVPKHELMDYLMRFSMYRSQLFLNASLVMDVCDPNS